MRAWMWAAIGATIAAAASCAEGGPGTYTTGSGGSGGGATMNGGAGTGGSTGSTSTSTSGGGAVDHAVVNEISATGEDWIEIANPTSVAIDLGDYGLCGDVDPAAGAECDTSTMVRFPKGTMLPPGGHLLIVGDQDPADGVGPHVMCLPSGGPTTCFYASWKVSASNGETVHLLDPDDDPVDEVKYPIDAVPDGQTWGRLPDGTGAFAANKPTPGDANAAP